MGAREEILNVCVRLAASSSDGTFTLSQVLDEMRRQGTSYSEATIRTHVTSRMCADAPDNHGTTYTDLRRVDRGLYRLG